MKFVPDEWLGGVLGYDVFRIDLEPNEPVETAQILPMKAMSHKSLVYVKIPATHIQQMGAFTTAGFKVIDVNVIFEREPQQLVLDGRVTVREARPEDEGSVLNIAGTSFEYSRFHLDPLLPREAADRIKREWVASYFHKGRGERLLVAEVDGHPAGFLCVLVTGPAAETGVIDLIGVDRQLQGRGIGRRLVEYHINDSVNKHSRLIVGTQIANIPSMRLYQACGYAISDSSYVLHAHVSEGRVL